MAQISKYLLLLLFIWTSNQIYSHPLIINLTNIDIVGDSVKVAIRISEKDLFEAVSNFHNLDESTNLSENNKSTEDLIMAYIEKNFTIGSNGINVNFDLTQILSENSAIWISIQGKISLSEATITIKNSLLCDTNNDVKNMVVISYKDIEEGVEFTLSETKKTIKISHKIN